MRVEGKRLIIGQKDINEDDFILQLSDRGVSESEIDRKVKNMLIDLGYDDREVKIHKTGIPKIDQYIPSKNPGGNGIGKLDVSLILNNELVMIIEDKEPVDDKYHSAEQAIDEAKYYANELRRYKNDIRIVVGFNGLNFKLNVYDIGTKEWIPFKINGKELNKFPSKKIIEYIYKYNITSIVISNKDENENHSKQIDSVIEQLRKYYRHISFFENNTQKTVDFTVSFIALKSMLEKYEDIIGQNWYKIGEILLAQKEDEDQEKYIRRCINTLKSNKFDYNENKILLQKVKNKIIEVKNLLIESDDIADNDKILDEVFKIKNKNGKVTFDFEVEIKQFKSIEDLKYLILTYFEISTIESMHSSSIDLFGEVYEKLSDKSTKKYFGEFFTRRHIIKALINLLYEDEVENIIGDIKEIDGKTVCINPRKICDPACGTGGFLTESFKYISGYINEFTKYSNFDYQDLAKKSFFGYDINGANIGRTKINMYLAGDGFSEIENLNTLSNNKLSNEKFDYIATNVPYGKGNNALTMYDTEVNESENRNYMENGSNRLEVNFLIKIIKLLKKNGKALVIVPDGILEAPSLSYLREWVVKNCKIEKIVGLPKHVFAPYTHEKTYAIYIKKRNKIIDNIYNIKNESIWMYIIDNDGYANSDKRFRTDNTDENDKWVDDEVSTWKNKEGVMMSSLLEERWNLKEHSEDEKFYNEWGDRIKGKKFGYVSMAEILKDEITTFKKLTLKNITNLINEEEIKKIVTCKADFIEDNIIKNEYKIILEDNEIVYNLNDEFIDRSNPNIKYIKKNEIKKILKEEGKNYRNNKDILDEKKLKIEIESILNEKEIDSEVSLKLKFLKKNNKVNNEEENISINFSEIRNILKENKISCKVIKDLYNDEYIIYHNVFEALKKESIDINIDYDVRFFKPKEITYNSIDEEDVIKLINKEIKSKLTKSKDIFSVDEDGEKVINESIEEKLLSLGIYYDKYEDEFLDKSVSLIKKLLILIPEYYFRNKLDDQVDIDKFKDENENMIIELFKLFIYEDKDKINNESFEKIRDILNTIEQENIVTSVGGAY